jgi:hypothetical protein
MRRRVAGISGGELVSEAVAVAPFDGVDGVWLRCALHTHTTNSDGWLTPEMLRRYHVAGGYDVLAITDHDGFTPEPPGDDDLIVIGGTEISLRSPKSDGPLHLLGIGITGMPEAAIDSSLAAACDAVTAAGGIPFVAHPVWSGLLTDEVEGIERAAGIEVYNSGCDVEQGRGPNDVHWDLWLSRGLVLGGIATDDLHLPGYEAFRGWTMVHARERSRAAVMEALASGRYYATMGPRISAVEFDGAKLTVRCTPVRAISALANPPFGARINAGHHELTYRGQRHRTPDLQAQEGIVDGELLTGATFHGDHPGLRYVRVVVEDDRGRRAWTNPIYLTPPAS